MVTRNQGAGLPIGEVLKRSRDRLKIDIGKAENDTRIRAKYLLALENEEWSVLPGPTYVKGYLRTYGKYLGLDTDALVDEYRRTIERSPATEQPYLFSEPLLERRRKPAPPRRRAWGQGLAILGILVLAVVAVFALVRTDPLNWFGNGGSAQHLKGKRQQAHHGSHGSAHAHGGKGHGGGGGGSGKPVSVSLVTHDEMVVCLRPGHGRPLIDAQTLVAGAKEGPFSPPAENYRLDLISGGSATLVVSGKPQRVHSKKPASFAIDAGGIRSVPYQGQKCP
jgi:helix-turn-helix protein